MIEYVKLEGVDEFASILRDIPIKLRRSTLRNGLASGARIVRDEARMLRRTSGAGSPDTGNAVPNYIRGSVERAINVRTSKTAKAAGDVGVFVNVRPFKALAGITKGRQNPADPFYWRFLEFGTKFMTARPFLTPAAAKLGDALTAFIAYVGPRLDKLNTNHRDPMT